MATYDPAVKAALQQALPGYTVTDADATWWTNNGGISAVRQQWPGMFANQPTVGGFHSVSGAPTPPPVAPTPAPAPTPVIGGYHTVTGGYVQPPPPPVPSPVSSTVPSSGMETVPAGMMVNPRPAGVGATVSEYQPAAGAEDIQRRNAIRQQMSQLKTQADLDRFLATSPFTAEQINEVFPEYGVADLKKEQSRAFRAMQGGSTIPEDLARQLDSLLQPGYGAARLQGGLNYSGLYSNEQAARDYIQRATQPRTGPEVLGGYHTTTGGYVQPTMPTVPAPTPTPVSGGPDIASTLPLQVPTGYQPWWAGGSNQLGNITSGLFGGGFSNPFFGGGGGMIGSGGGYVPFSSLLQPFGQRGFGNYGYIPLMSGYGGYGGFGDYGYGSMMPSYGGFGGYSPMMSNYGGYSPYQGLFSQLARPQFTGYSGGAFENQAGNLGFGLGQPLY